MKILVIDDQPEYLGWIQDLTENLFVQLCDGPKEGIKAARQGDFDLVITDYMMPEMRGDKVKVYLHELMPELPVFIWSSVPSDCPIPCYEKNSASFKKFILAHRNSGRVDHKV